MRRTLLVLALLSLQSCSCSPKQTHQSAGVLNVTETALDFGALCPRPDGPDVLVSSLTASELLDKYWEVIKTPNQDKEALQKLAEEIISASLSN